MTDSIANNKRIAKNTILLYVRMFIMMAVGLFTSRIILDALGVSDYGIYNVIGGRIKVCMHIYGHAEQKKANYQSYFHIMSSIIVQN